MFVKFDFVTNTKAKISIIVAIILIPFLGSKKKKKMLSFYRIKRNNGMHWLPPKKLCQGTEMLAAAQLPYWIQNYFVCLEYPCTTSDLHACHDPVPGRSQVTDPVACCCHVVHHFYNLHQPRSEVVL